MEKLKHTGLSWHWHFEKTLNLAGKGSYENGDILRCKMGPESGDRELILLAPTAPHSCADPTCPGDVNRRKLQVAEEMAKVCEKIRDHADLNMALLPGGPRPLYNDLIAALASWDKAGKGSL